MAYGTDTLGDFLKSRRIAAGFTQRQIATKLKYSSPQFISNWERGISSPPLNVLSKLVKLYSINPEILIEIIIEDTRCVLKNELTKEKKQRIARR